jgi:hypothetical protein
MQYSSTYRGVAVMLLAFVLKSAGHNLPDADVANMVADIVMIAGAFNVLYQRYLKGGIHWTGFKQ